MLLEPFDVADPAHSAAMVVLWGDACGPELAVSPRLAGYNTRPATGALQAGQLAIHAGQPVGFVIASALLDDPDTSPQMGWMDAIAVTPGLQRQGIGSELLAWAENWLARHGCTRVRLGGSLRHWAPGLPVELGADSFFRNRGYRERADAPYVWDVARDLGNYHSDLRPLTSGVEIQPAQPGQEDALLSFLSREFPGRWRFELIESLRERGRISDYVLLWTERGVDGFCRLTFEDSERPVERYYMHRLPRPWGQLGPIGVSRNCRGKGYGAALLDAGLRYLRDSGVRGCVIDWTSLLEFYARFGFEPYRQYVILLKQLTHRFL